MFRAGVLTILALMLIATGRASASQGGTSTGALPDLSPELINELMQKTDAAQNTKASKETTKESKKSTAASASTATNVTATDESLPVFKKDADVASAKAPTETSPWGRMMVSLIVVLGLVGGAYYGFKRLPAAKKITQRARMIEVMSQHHLGPRKSLAVVRVAGETVLIGVTDSNISILKTLSLLDEEATSYKGNFSGALQNKVSAQSKEDKEEFTMESLKGLIGERLKQMKEL